MAGSGWPFWFLGRCRLWAVQGSRWFGSIGDVGRFPGRLGRGLVILKLKRVLAVIVRGYRLVQQLGDRLCLAGDRLIQECWKWAFGGGRFLRCLRPGPCGRCRFYWLGLNIRSCSRCRFDWLLLNRRGTLSIDDIVLILSCRRLVVVAQCHLTCWQVQQGVLHLGCRLLSIPWLGSCRLRHRALCFSCSLDNAFGRLSRLAGLLGRWGGWTALLIVKVLLRGRYWAFLSS